MKQFIAVRIKWRLVKKNIVINPTDRSWLDIRKLVCPVHLRLLKLLLYLSLEQVQFVFHVPINVVIETLLRMIVVAILPLFVCERRYHLTIEFPNFISCCFASFYRRGTF